METVIALLEGTAGISILSLAAVFGFIFNLRADIFRTIRLGLIISLPIAIIVGLIYLFTPACNNPLIYKGSFTCENPSLIQTLFLIVVLTVEMCLGVFLGCLIQYGTKFIIKRIQEYQTSG